MQVRPGNSEAMDRSGRALRRLCAALLTVAISAGPLGPGVALAAELPSEVAYRQRANAQDAEAAARSWLASGHLGRAINWIERMVRSPGATAAQQRWADQQRAALEKTLFEQGFARVAIQVTPATALIEIDGRALAPQGDNHLVWLKEGPHRLLASAAGHQPQERDLPLSRGEKRKLELKLTAIAPPRLQVEVEPAAQLWVDGVLRGQGLRLSAELTIGSHRVELRAAGYASFERTLSFAESDLKVLNVRLQAAGAADGVRRPVASNVDRPVLASEKSADPLGLAKDRPAGPGLPAGDAARAGLALPAKGGQSSAEIEPQSGARQEAGGGQADAPEPPQEAQAQAIAAEPWSDAAKGWMLAGPGLALLGGGALMAMWAAADAEQVNQRPYGDANYDADYDAAGTRALMGYAAASVGAGLSAWGGWYLLARRGLGPQGRGILIGGSGAALAAAGAWLWLDAGELGDSAATLPVGHPDVDRRQQLSDRNRLIAVAVAGSGAALIGVGIWQGLAGTAAPAGSAQTWQLTPLLAPEHAGAVWTLRW